MVEYEIDYNFLEKQSNKVVIENKILIPNVYDPLQKEKYEASIKNQNVATMQYSQMTRCEIKGNIERVNGDNIIIMEESYTKITQNHGTQTNEMNNVSDYKSTLLHEDIILLCLKNDGTTRWTTRVRKTQKSIGHDLYSSFYYQEVGNKIYFLFNDHPDNLKKNWNDKKEIATTFYINDVQAILALVIVDSNDGTQTREKIYDFNPQKTEVAFVPSKTSKTSQKQALTYSENLPWFKGSRFKFGKITFKD